MKGIWEHDWFMIPICVFFGAGLAMVMIVPYGDEILFFNSWRIEPFVSIFKVLSWCGETWTWVISVLVALFLRFRFALMIAMTGLIIPLVFIIKDNVGVDRPITYFQKTDKTDELVTVPQVVLNTGQTSFPSGHTMSAFGLCSILSLIVGQKSRKRVFLLVLLAILVGVARIFLVQHFLVDVLAGAFLGIVVSGLVWWLIEHAYFQEKTWLDEKLKLRKY